MTRKTKQRWLLKWLQTPTLLICGTCLLASAASAQVVVHKFTYDSKGVKYQNLTTPTGPAANPKSPFPTSIIAAIKNTQPKNPMVAMSWNGDVFIASVALKKSKVLVSQLKPDPTCQKKGKRKDAYAGKEMEFVYPLRTAGEWIKSEATTAELAINTHFFFYAADPGSVRTDKCGAVTGLSRRENVSQPAQPDIKAKVNNNQNVVSLVFGKDNKASIVDSSKALTGHNVVSGVPLLTGGKYVPSGPDPDVMHARTAVCLKPGGLLWIVAWVPKVNGVKAGSGVKLEDLASLMSANLNCDSAINFDGSGSAQLYYKKKGTGTAVYSNTSDSEKSPRPVISFLGFESL